MLSKSEWIIPNQIRIINFCLDYSYSVLNNKNQFGLFLFCFGYSYTVWNIKN